MARKHTNSWIDRLEIDVPTDPIAFIHDYLSVHDMMMIEVDRILWTMVNSPTTNAKLRLAAITQLQARNEQLHRRQEEGGVANSGQKTVTVSYSIKEPKAITGKKSKEPVELDEFDFN